MSEPEATKAALLEARGIAKHYGHVTALRGVDFTLQLGETHAIVGDNGAGKSTLVKVLSGAIEPSEGTVLIDGDVVSFAGPEDAFRAGISTVYQNLALVGCRNIAENLFLGKEPTRYGVVLKAQMHREAAEMLTGLRQMNVRDTTAKVEDLSGGQRQAVAIARGMHQARRILILDEPTAALGVQESAGDPQPDPGPQEREPVCRDRQSQPRARVPGRRPDHRPARRPARRDRARRTPRRRMRSSA